MDPSDENGYRSAISDKTQMLLPRSASHTGVLIRQYVNGPAALRSEPTSLARRHIVIRFKGTPDYQPGPSTPGTGSGEPAPQKAVRIVVWIVILLIFAIGFILILRHHDNTPAKPSRRGAAGGTTTITTATAQKGDIGVYLDAIGTVTPVYTASITSQVNGVGDGGALSRGPDRPPGRSADRHRLAHLSRHAAAGAGHSGAGREFLAQAKMDLDRYQEAWAAMPSPSRRWTIRKRSCCRTRARSRTIRVRCSSTRCRSATATSLRPLPAGSVCAWSIPATSCRPRAGRRSRSSPRSSPSPSSSRLPKTIWGRCSRGCVRERSFRSMSSTGRR